MRMRFEVIGCVIVIATSATASKAQANSTGTLVGTVVRDSSDVGVGQAQVELPALNRSAITNSLGAFQFSDVPSGRYAITVRAVGFQPFIDSLNVKPGIRIDVDLVLTVAAVNLDAQHTTATAPEQHVPPDLKEMADRMKTHLGGYFVTDSMLRANNEKKLTELIAKIPHVAQQLSPTGTGIYLANGREHGDGKGVFTLKTEQSAYETFPHDQCYINVFIDGAPFFLGPATEENPPPDFAAMWAHDYSGIEYYPGGATIPAQYNGSKTSCGLLLLWTRRTP